MMKNQDLFVFDQLNLDIVWPISKVYQIDRNSRKNALEDLPAASGTGL